MRVRIPIHILTVLPIAKGGNTHREGRRERERAGTRKMRASSRVRRRARESDSARENKGRRGIIPALVNYPVIGSMDRIVDEYTPPINTISEC